MSFSALGLPLSVSGRKVQYGLVRYRCVAIFRTGASPVPTIKRICPKLLFILVFFVGIRFGHTIVDG
jgi:hypothetical protein